MDNIELLNYLNDDDKKKIAERVFEEECRNLFKKDIECRSSEIFHNRSIVYQRILEKYISEMNLTHHEFIPAFKTILDKEIKDIINPEDPDQDNSLKSCIIYKLQQIANEVISENTKDLKPIIKEKVFKCCNETLLIAFLSDIVKQMNLDSAVKKIIQESEGNKV